MRRLRGDLTATVLELLMSSCVDVAMACAPILGCGIQDSRLAATASGLR